MAGHGDERTGTQIIEQRFGERGGVPFPFQRETWAAYLAECSGLIFANTRALLVFARDGEERVVLVTADPAGGLTTVVVVGE